MTNAPNHRSASHILQQLSTRVLLLQAVSGYKDEHEVLHVACDAQQLLNL